MKLRVRYFAALREALGPAEALELPGPASVADLLAALRQRSPRHAEALGPDRALRAAVDQRMCRGDQPLADGQEVAFFPPVTGG